MQGYGDDAGRFFEMDRGVAIHCAEFTGPGEDECGAQVGMTRERHLLRRGEDAHAARVALFGGQYECRFGEIELACDLLHLAVRQS